MGLSTFFLRKEVDFPRSDEALEKWRLLLLRCLVVSPEAVVGVAGEAGRTDLFVGEDEAVAVAGLGGDFGGGGGGTEEGLVGEEDSNWCKYSASRSRLWLWSCSSSAGEDFFVDFFPKNFIERTRAAGQGYIR